jgi:hypothetical protein
MLWNKGNAGMGLEAKATQEVAGPLGVTLQDRGVKGPDELEMVFAALTNAPSSNQLPTDGYPLQHLLFSTC